MPLACEDGQPVEAHQVILTLFSCSVFPSYPLPFPSKPKITNLKEHCPTQCSVVCMTLPPKLSRQIIWNVGRKKIQRFDSKTASKMHEAQQVFSIRGSTLVCFRSQFNAFGRLKHITGTYRRDGMEISECILPKVPLCGAGNYIKHI